MKITEVNKCVRIPIGDGNGVYKYLKVFEADYTCDGKPGKWVFTSRKEKPLPLCDKVKPDAVIIVALTGEPEDRRLVVTKEFRVPLNDYEYGFPAGLVDPGEDEHTTAIRELKEETNLDGTVIKVTKPIFSSPGMTDECVSMVFVEAKGTPSDQNLEGSEAIETILMDIDQLILLLEDKDKKVGAKAWPIMYMYTQMGM